MGMLDEILNSIQDSGAASDPGKQQGMSPIATFQRKNREPTIN